MAPLNKRLPREFVHNLGKYLGLFLMLVFAISATTGFLVAASSIEKVQAEAPETLNMEDLHFATQFELSRSDKEAVEALGGTLYEDFCSNQALVLAGSAKELRVRLIENRAEVNLASYFEGSVPAEADEIALDRVFCNNNDVHVGDLVTVNGYEMRVSGIMSLADYQCQMEKNTDMMFNAVTFSVSQVTHEGFERASGGKVEYRYDMVLDDRSMGLTDRIDLEEDLADLLSDRGVLLTDLVDSESNMAVFFATDDVKSDQRMWEALMCILVVIMAFVFVVLTSATIEEESAVIGTLLASGYRKRELIAHYMVLPTLMGLLGGVIGNVLGYTLLSEPMRALYYNSYSLPPYVATFNPRVLILTTIVPFVLLVGITFLGLARKLRATPLAFLCHEIGRKSRRANLRLPEGMGFVLRFRLRVFFRNLSHFVVLFFGIAFCSIFLLFGLCLMPLVEHYVGLLQADIPANHLYMLKAPLEIEGTAADREAWAAIETLATTKDPEETLDLVDFMDLSLKAMSVDTGNHPVNTFANSDEARAQAEKFVTTSLEVPRVIDDGNEGVTIYGIVPESRYWSELDVAGDAVVVGAGLASKCKLEVGVPVVLTDKYTNKRYELTPTAVWGTSANMNVYMALDRFNEFFDNDEGYFNAYASDLPLELAPRYLVTDVTPESMTSSADQMQSSMGGIASMMLYMAIPIYLILIYLLTKTVIDRSARYISYMKVFGYHDGEISRLYVRSITATVLVSLVASLPLVIWIVALFVRVIMDSYAGNLKIVVEPYLLAEIVCIGAVAYLVIAALHMWHIRRVSLSEAMKVQE